jgi:hypothetical protein
VRVKELLYQLSEQDPESQVSVFIPEIMYEDSAGDVLTTVSHIASQNIRRFSSSREHPEVKEFSGTVVEIYCHPKE